MSLSSRTIVCPLDGSAVAERALEPAVALAAASGLRLVLVRSIQLYGMDVGWYTQAGAGAPVYPAPSMVPLEEMVATARAEAERYLGEVAGRLEGRGLVGIDRVLSDAHPAEAILETAGTGAAFIVMATHGAGGFQRWVLGSMAEKVVQSSPVPVLLIRADDADEADAKSGEAWRPQRFLVTLDGSTEGEAVLAPVAELARAFGAELTLLHVVIEPPGLGWTATLKDVKAVYTEAMVAYLATQARQLTAQGLTVRTQVQSATDAAEAILTAEKDLGVDLVALATHGYGGWRRLALGSVADRVVRGATLPVLLVRCPVGGE